MSFGLLLPKVNFAKLVEREESSTEPSNKGAPRRDASHGRMWMKSLKRGKSNTGTGEITSHLDSLRESPISSPRTLMFRISWFTVPTGPPNVTSSSYAMFDDERKDWRIGWRVRQKSNGPRGSPCLTPSADVIDLQPSQKRITMVGSMTIGIELRNRINNSL